MLQHICAIRLLEQMLVAALQAEILLDRFGSADLLHTHQLSIDILREGPQARLHCQPRQLDHGSSIECPAGDARSIDLDIGWSIGLQSLLDLPSQVHGIGHRGGSHIGHTMSQGDAWHILLGPGIAKGLGT